MAKYDFEHEKSTSQEQGEAMFNVWKNSGFITLDGFYALSLNHIIRVRIINKNQEKYYEVCMSDGWSCEVLHNSPQGYAISKLFNFPIDNFFEYLRRW